jgi:hypothetical protein
MNRILNMYSIFYNNMINIRVLLIIRILIILKILYIYIYIDRERERERERERDFFFFLNGDQDLPNPTHIPTELGQRKTNIKNCCLQLNWRRLLYLKLKPVVLLYIMSCIRYKIWSLFI